MEGLHPAVDRQSKRMEPPGTGHNRQTATVGFGGVLHPAVDGQSSRRRMREPPKAGQHQTDSNGRYLWKATSCSRWTNCKAEGEEGGNRLDQDSIKQTAMEGVGGGSTSCSRWSKQEKYDRTAWNTTASCRQQWRALVEFYILQ